MKTYLETIVRNGHYFTVGDNGAEFANIRSGDVIFNHKQTEELFKNGYVTSGGGRAKVVGESFVTGTAYRLKAKDNTKPKTPKNTNNSKTTKKSGSSSSNNNNNKKKKKTTKKKDPLAFLDEYWDWVEIKLKRVNAKTEKAITQIERSATLNGKLAKNDTARKQVKHEKSTNDAAAKRYLKQANIVAKKTGLKSGTIKKIKNGKIDIDSYGEKTQKKIQGYQTWYDKYLEAKNTAAELAQKEKELAKERLSYIKDYYNSVVSLKNTLKDVADSQRELNKSIGLAYGSNEDYEQYKTATTRQKEAYNKLKEQLAKQQAEFKKLTAPIKETVYTTKTSYKKQTVYKKDKNGKVVKDKKGNKVPKKDKNGKVVKKKVKVTKKVPKKDKKGNTVKRYVLDKKGNKTYKLNPNSAEAYGYQQELEELKKSMNEAAASYYDIQKEMRDIKITKFQNVVDALERSLSKLNSQVELNTSRGKKTTNEEYQKQINTNVDEVNSLYKQLQQIRENQKYYAVGSENYNDYEEQASNVTSSIYEKLKNIEDIKDTAFEARTKEIEEQIEKYKTLQSELDSFYDLLNEEAFWDKNGKMTEDGAAGISLIAQSMAAAKQQVADYTAGLEKLQEMLDNGLITEDEYADKSKEYIQGVQDSVAANHKYEQSLISLYQTQMQKEIDAINKSIDARKKALSQKKAYYDYDKTLKEKNKDVNLLKAQISALEGVNNATAQAQLKKLKADLADAQDDLDDTRKDHENDMREQGYDKMSEDLSKMLEDTEYELTHNSEKQQEIVKSMLDNMVNMYGDAYKKIDDIIKKGGWVGSDLFDKGIGDSSTKDGAQNNANKATESQTNTNKNPSSTISNVSTSDVSKDSSGKSAEERTSDIEKKVADDKPITKNRQVMSFSVSKSSVTVQAGKTVSVTAKVVQPADAANSFTWKSSNTRIATVSGGKIKGVKAGTCTVTVYPTNNTGLIKEISVKVTAKSSGKAKAKFDIHMQSGSVSSKNHASSSKKKTSSNKKSSSKKKSTAKLTAKKKKATPIKSHALGSKSIPNDQIAWTQENGEEAIIRRKSDGAILTRLGKGDMVLPANATSNLWDWASINPNTALNGIDTSVISSSNVGGNTTITNHYDSLLTVEGNVDKDALPGLKDLLEMSYKHTSQRMYEDAKKTGMRRSF